MTAPKRPNPTSCSVQFEGQTKGRLGNPEVRPAVESVLSEELSTLFEWRPDILNAIVDKATEAQQAAGEEQAGSEATSL